jgi:hypothetical protein
VRLSWIYKGGGGGMRQTKKENSHYNIARLSNLKLHGKTVFLKTLILALMSGGKKNVLVGVC